jgi:hypothetical protein
MNRIMVSLVILMIGSGVALAQGTQQSSVPSGGGYNRVEPIGHSGSPVQTPQSGSSGSAMGYVPPASRSYVIVAPQRRSGPSPGRH